MIGKIHQYLAEDHRRLDALLARALTDPEKIDAAAYAEFRSGLLKHIAMEEKILLRAAKRMRGGKALDLAARLRLDHGALTALLVPPPSASVIAAIRAILEAHNSIEEGPGGIYEQCDDLLGADGDETLRQLQGAREVKVLPHVDSSFVMDAARRAVTRAGYDLEL